MKQKLLSIKGLCKRGLAMMTAFTMILGMLPAVSVHAAEETEELLKAGSISVTEGRVTDEQPLAAGTADSSKFRIPAFITLENGDLLAAADARWTGGADWGGLDTIASVSSDNGKTWSYSFPMYFPDSNTVYPGTGVATTIIDPVLVQGSDGTVYCIADVNPTGITTGDIMPSTGTGYVEIDGVDRLVLFSEYVLPVNADLDAYEYYVGDFTDGMAPVLNREDGSATQWAVDGWYNIYEVNEDGSYTELTQTQVNSSTVIQQNAFYKDSVLHVFNTGYIWMVKSTDNGRSWSAPVCLNSQIKRSGEIALLASPGQGMVTKDGDIVVPFYDHGDGQENASIIWSSDNGETWKRSNDVSGMWSSESEVVELNNGVLRMFYRNGNGIICYADAEKDANGDWVMGTGVKTNLSVCSTCNVTAIRHSEEIDGKAVVMVGCPGGSGRANGKIYTFLVDEDNSMELYNIYSINDGYYAYSCMAELSNGNIGLLWENAGTAIRYDELEFDVVVGHTKNIQLSLGSKYIEEVSADAVKEITQQADASIAEVTSELVVEESTIVLHNHTANVESSVTGSFSAEADSTMVLSDAEFTFNASGDYWQIYNEAKGLYLTNDSVASAFFSSTAGDMKVTASEEVDGTFTICKSSGSRYVIFYNANMDFNSNGNFSANYTAGSYNLTLLEKQDTISEDDVVPGYKQATEIVDGNKYLIAHIWSDGSVIVLYPTNGTANQTKLVGEAQTLSKNVITITAVAIGSTTAVIDGVTYNITVPDPKDDPEYAGSDIPVSALTATAGNIEADHSDEGPAANVLDDNTSTLWHTDWDGWAREDHWIQFEISGNYVVDGLRYLPRTDAGNGTITKYQILVSSDGETWSEVEAGTWAQDATWKKVSFDPSIVKYVRLVSVASVSDNSKQFSSAAEIRLTGTLSECEEHDWTLVNEVPATCTEAGYSGDLVCGECGALLMHGGETDPTGHTWGEWEVVTEPTHTEKGLKERSCSVCEETETEEIDVLTVVNPFEDVTEDQYWYDAVMWAASDSVGVTNGTSDTTFSPWDNCTRGHVVTFLYRAMGCPEVTNKENPFVDVTEDAFYYDAVLWAVENGITDGTSATTFDPAMECTRGQIVTFLYRNAGKPQVDTTANPFTDVAADSYYLTSILWAVENGITDGTSETTFAPDVICNRGTAVTFLYRALVK